MAGGISVRRMSADRMPTSRGITRLADIPDGERRDGGPESPGCGIRGRQESPAKLAEALAWLADLGSVAADRICLMPQE